MSSARNSAVEIFTSKLFSHSSTIYLYAQNDPIIESSDNLTFAPYNLSYPFLLEQMNEAELDPYHNRWDVIFDFTEKEVEGVKISNFKTLDPAQFEIHQIPIEGIDHPFSKLPLP